MQNAEPQTDRLRGLVAFVVSVGVYYVAQRVINPAVAARLEPMLPPSDGLGLFLRHLLEFSTLDAFLCLGTWYAFARAGWLGSPRAWLGFGPEPRHAIRWGVVIGVALSAAVVVVGVALGEKVHFHPDGWKMAGNIFSNYFEELIYRGLLLQAAWAMTGSRIGGVVLSSALFGWSHAHGSHAAFMAVAASVAGLVFGLAAIRTRSLGGAWTAHQISDMILDSL
jgi:membrane protease YdiL (CAAX protease family)